MPPTEQVQRILADIDRYLLDRASIASRPRVTVCAAGRTTAPEIDIAIMTAGNEQYDTLLGRLDVARPVTGTHAHLNRFSWIVGGLENQDGKQYRL